MPKYVALLRGIAPTNPNMRNEKLRDLFEKLGFTNVQSVIASGNITFESPSKNISALESKIEKAITENLGFTSTTIIRSLDQLEELVRKDVFKGTEDKPTSRLNVTFLQDEPATELRFPYYSKDKSYTVLGIFDQAVFSAIDLSGTKTPDVMLWLEKQFGKKITTRTWKTVEKIIKKLSTTV